jgi:hypothetical protein
VTFELADFSFWRVAPRDARFVAGLGRTYNLSAAELARSAQERRLRCWSSRSPRARDPSRPECAVTLEARDEAPRRMPAPAACVPDRILVHPCGAASAARAFRKRTAGARVARPHRRVSVAFFAARARGVELAALGLPRPAAR